MSVRRRVVAHECRAHVLARVLPSGVTRFVCSVCRKPIAGLSRAAR
jgi:hypothetical protein